MIEFGEVENSFGVGMVGGLLIEEEFIFASFKGERDMEIFTNRGTFAVNAQRMTGEKTDFSTLPYTNIQAYSMESAGTFDRDTELELWFSGLGEVRFEFHAPFDVKAFSRFIRRYMLQAIFAGILLETLCLMKASGNE